MSTGFFPTTSIPFEGPESENPLAFRYYDPNDVNGGVISGHWGGAKVGHLVSRLGA